MEPLPPAPTPRQRSIRSVVGVGMGSLLAALFVLPLTVVGVVNHLSSERASLRGRYDRAIEAADTALRTLLEQEVGLSRFIATGGTEFLAPYRAGRANQAQAFAALAASLTDEDRPAAGEPVARFEKAAAEWHATVAEPQIDAARSGAAPALAAALRLDVERFGAVRDAHGAVARVLRARRVERIGAYDTLVLVARRIAMALILAATVAGVLLVRFTIRNTAVPLGELVAAAAAREPFRKPSPEDTSIREVHALALALHELDTAVRERESALADARQRAVALAEFGEHIQQLVDSSELHRVLAHRLDEQASPAKMHILVRDASAGGLELAWPGATPEAAHLFPILADPQKCRAVRTLKPVTANAGAPTACDCALGVPERGGYHCMPMLAAGELVGVVNLQALEPDRFTPPLHLRLQGFVNFASTTLSSLRLLAAARERALRDPLTGVYNRAFLTEFLAKQLALARRRGAPLSVLVFDLDHFKRLNDTYGHPQGDRALVAFASCLLAQTRSSDAVVRYGGEEFVVVLADADLPAALAVAERMRRAVEATVVGSPADAPGNLLRASVGVAAFPGHGEDEATLVAAADRALYRAKTTGRNRVVAADG